jgi:hypothetical protein
MDLLKLANLFCEASLKHNCVQRLNNIKSAEDINDSRAVKRLDNLTILDNAIKNLVSNNPRYGIRLNNVNHIGFNMNYKFNTPLGIYFYPLIPEIYNQAISGNLPFLKDEPYIHLIKFNGKILTVQTYNNFDEDFEKMKSLHPDINIDKSKFRGTDFQKLKQLFHFYGKQSGERSTFYNYKYYRKLGYDSIIDLGDSEIHENEPIQGTIFSPQGYEVVEAFINPFRTRAAYKDYSRDFVEIPKNKNPDLSNIRKWDIRFKALSDLINKNPKNIHLLNEETDAYMKHRLALPFFKKYKDPSVLPYISDPTMRTDLAIDAFKETGNTHFLHYIYRTHIKSDLAIKAFKETGNITLFQYIAPDNQSDLAINAFKETGKVALFDYIPLNKQSDLAINAFKKTKDINLLRYIDDSTTRSDLAINEFKKTKDTTFLWYIDDIAIKSDVAIDAFKETGNTNLLYYINDPTIKSNFAISAFKKTKDINLLPYIKEIDIKPDLAIDAFKETGNIGWLRYIVDSAIRSDVALEKFKETGNKELLTHINDSALLKQAEAFKIAIDNFTEDDLDVLRKILETPDKYTLEDMPSDLLEQLKKIEQS